MSERKIVSECACLRERERERDHSFVRSRERERERDPPNKIYNIFNSKREICKCRIQSHIRECNGYISHLRERERERERMSERV